MPQQTPPAKLTRGTSVQYILPDGSAKGQQRPAIVVEHWPDSQMADLWVFPRASTDGPKYQDPFFVTAPQNASGKPGTWN